MFSLHVSTVQRDKAILLYAIVHDIKFDLEFVIKNSILKVLYNRCTGALTHHSLITLLYKLAGVPMSESEEKTPPKMPLHVPKSKNCFEEEPNAKAKEEESEESKEDEPTIEEPHGLMDPRV